MSLYRLISAKQMDTLLAFRSQSEYCLLGTHTLNDASVFYQEYRSFILRLDNKNSYGPDYHKDYHLLQCMQYAYDLKT